MRVAAEEEAARSRCPGVHPHLKRSTSSRSRFSTLVISTLRRSPGGGGGPDPGPAPAPPASPGAPITSAKRDRHRDPTSTADQEAPPIRGAKTAI